MGTRDHRSLNAIILTTTYNNIFRRIFNEFEKKIFLKINNKEPVDETWTEYLAAGCVPKPTYFISAVYYMRVELTHENRYDLRDNILCQLYPIFKNSSKEKMEFMLRVILEELSSRILQMNVVTFEDIKNISFRDILLASSKVTSSREFDGEQLKAMLMSLPLQRNALQTEYENYVDSLVKSRAALWKIKNGAEREYERGIESDFVVSAVRLK